MNPKTLTPKQIAEILDTLEALNQIGDSVKARAVELAHQGVDIPGWEASFSSPRRAWADDEQANAELAKLGLDKRDRYSVELLSPAQAEKKLKEKKLWPKKPKGSAGDDFTDPFKAAGLLADKEGNPTIRRASGNS
jgi:hypothetical protein